MNQGVFRERLVAFVFQSEAGELMNMNASHEYIYTIIIGIEAWLSENNYRWKELVLNASQWWRGGLASARLEL